MSIYIHGREADLASVYAGDEQVTQIWSGDEIVWPDLGDGKWGIFMDTPKVSSADYGDWYYILDAINKGATDASNYLKFTVNGVDYYISTAPRGEQQVTLEGDTIILTDEQKTAIEGYTGDTLTLKAKIAARVLGWKEFVIGNAQNHSWQYPLVKGSFFRFYFYARTNNFSTIALSIHGASTMPSSTYISLNQTSTYNRNNPGWHTVNTRTMTSNEVVATDTSCSLSFTRDSLLRSQGYGVTLMSPAIDRTFELNISTSF